MSEDMAISRLARQLVDAAERVGQDGESAGGAAGAGDAGELMSLDTGERWVDVPLDLDEAGLGAWREELRASLVADDPAEVDWVVDYACAVATTPADDAVWGRFVLLPAAGLAPVAAEVLVLAAAPGNEEAALAEYVLVGPDERGPHVYDTVDLANGCRAVRAVAGIEVPVSPTVSALPLCSFHALRLGAFDVIVRTVIGHDLRVARDAIEQVEALLGTAAIDSAGQGHPVPPDQPSPRSPAPALT